MTLSGVLKDILLVVLSVLIWRTPVTPLQIYGYSIALGGLIYYKIGDEQAKAIYAKVVWDENSLINRAKRSPLVRFVGVGVLLIVALLAWAHSSRSS